VQPLGTSVEAAEFDHSCCCTDRRTGVLGRNYSGQQRVRRQGQVEPPGNPFLQGARGAAAMSCAQNPRTYLGARDRRIAQRRGPQKANVPIQHSMLMAIWHMATNGCLDDDPGADYFNRLHPQRAKNGPSPNSRPWATTSA
jgi:hypothetical protein